MRSNKRRNKMYFLLILLLCLGIGYAALSTTLKINSAANIAGNTWDIYWDDPQVVEGSIIDSPPIQTEDDGEPENTKLVWNVNLDLPGDYYEFTIDAVNNGTINAMLTGINSTITPELPTDAPFIKLEVTYADGKVPRVNDELQRKRGNVPTRVKYRIRVEYDEEYATASTMNNMSDNSEYTFSLEINYGQSTVEHQKYALGALVQYDPVNDEVCTSGDTCYNWRVITHDDLKTDNIITLQMDHNITPMMEWVTKADYNDDTAYGRNGNNNKGPITILKTLENLTSDWTDDLKLNYTYDTTGAVSNYGVLSCVDGVCKIRNNTITNNLKARIITGEELAAITVAAGAEKNSNAYNWTLASSNNDEWYFFSRSNYKLGTKDLLPSGQTSSTQLSWLVHNTTANGYSGATNNSYGSNNGGYWTLSPVSNDSTHAWSVGGSSYEPYNGNVGAYYVNNYSSYGIRPVITILKSKIS